MCLTNFIYANTDTLNFYKKHTIYFNPAKLPGDVVGLSNFWFCGGYRYGMENNNQIDLFIGTIIYSQAGSGYFQINADKSKGIMGGFEYMHTFDERRKAYWAINSTIHYTQTGRSDIGPPLPPLYTTNPILNYTVFRTSISLMPKIGYIMHVKGKWQYVDVSIGAGVRYITSQNNLDNKIALHNDNTKEFPYGKVFDYGSVFVFSIALDLKFMRTFNKK